ncbi:MAG: phosphoribosylformimino-5-aminoimidazole carboxamide ribotide isomerase [Muribaculaceae bacterium]|nr:phosphoribosylformimino-5-aminoimidazole carboxamide ribotide isomerase [Roseburia sp.]MCM1431931.1 phosphoribosylformimino-5-aminoimidazole carboxamide ribotide isomerase [Muribaculaceae bacterium]MCM1493549.1 phosphoribosylformimino-5-aminoimidazole carboxamide ribotide isomerase [Muribaculaceae bacterium]
MEFRPCIDIHNGKVKQIVGASLRDEGDFARENFVSGQDAAFYAGLYRRQGLRDGHVILLNSADSACYEAGRQQAFAAFREYPGGLQAGGGITAGNAAEFLQAGASAVIVTSYVFRDGYIHFGNLERLYREVGREHLVLDLSCRKKPDGKYYIVTDRWQKFTNEQIVPALLDELGEYCREFLVHAVDVEGKSGGIERELVSLLGEWGKQPVTYAGGVHSFSDLEEVWELGKGKLHVTIGSALDLFGGPMSYEKVLQYIKSRASSGSMT